MAGQTEVRAVMKRQERVEMEAPAERRTSMRIRLPFVR
jgi:hypothetical protein